MLKGTPLHDRTSKLCQSFSWVTWGDYSLPGYYTNSVLEEALSMRYAAGLFDLSPFSKYHVHGRDAVKALNHIFTRDISKLKPMRGVYTTWCNFQGKVLQEGVVFRLTDDHFMICATYPDFDWFHQATQGYDVVILDRSKTEAAIALQGPNSCHILQELSEIDFKQLKYFDLARGNIGGVPCIISRTGYTGDLGYEIWVAADAAVKIWDAILTVGQPYGVYPCGLLALDVARVEAGFLLGGDSDSFAPMGMGDYTRASEACHEAQMVSPYEIGLDWAVDFTKDDFIGRDALYAEQQRGRQRCLVGIEVLSAPFEQLYASHDLKPDYPPRVAQWIVPLYSPRTGGQIGYVTSRVWSPYLRKYIALAFVDSAYAVPGTLAEMECTVLYERRRTPVVITERPFLKLGRARTANPFQKAEDVVPQLEKTVVADSKAICAPELELMENRV
jgi:aminomethyltransferase